MPYCYDTLHPCFCASVLRCFRASMLQCFSAFVHLCFHASMLPWRSFCASVLLVWCRFCASLLPWCHVHASVLPCFHDSVISCFCAFVLPCFPGFLPGSCGHTIFHSDADFLNLTPTEYLLFFIGAQCVNKKK